MNTKWIKIALLIVVGVMAAVVYLDYRSTKPGQGPANPFEYSIDEYKEVDASMISHRETRQIRLQGEVPIDIAWGHDKIYLITDVALKSITTAGREIFAVRLDNTPQCLAVSSDGYAFVGFNNHLISFNPDGEEIARSAIGQENATYTSIAISQGKVFVADAGTKQVLIFDTENLIQTGSFKGESGVSDLHGFILPSAHFDLAVNSEQELWVVNPGMHALQNYTEDGRLRGHWRQPAFDLSGFSGCCNPSHIAFLSDGRVVTSEKGLVRIKIHKISGTFDAVVAPPSSFVDGLRAPAIAIDDQDNIIALDFDRQLIRYFEKK